jgi:hypothetical protein
MTAYQSAPAWARFSVQAGTGLVILALFVSAVSDPTIRVLHALQALIYVAAIVLARRDNAWGLGAGCIIAAFWNYMNLFVSNFIATGLRELSLLLTAGELRPGQIAVVAAIGHFLLIFGCLALFLQLRPRLRLWRQFVGGGVLAVGYLVLIVFATGPQFVGILRQVFRV